MDEGWSLPEREATDSLLILRGMWVPFGGSHIPQHFCPDAALVDGSVAPSTGKEGLGDGTVPAGEQAWAFLSLLLPWWPRASVVLSRS